MDPFLGEIVMFAGNFAPRGWAFCDGQLMAISQNTALFSILGTTYGGDGRTTFALPDLRGRAAIHPGTGPGLSNYRLGQRGGVETVTLNQLQIPSHSHIAIPSTSGGTANINATAVLHADSTGATNDPTDKFPANVPNAGPSQVKAYGSNADITMNAGAVTVTGTVDLGTIPAPTIGNTGGNQWHTNIQPFECVNFIIAMVGTFPSRN
ncbi:microcystin-dependent protein [Roseivirga ehrenbergii]|nr:tail fiber protein [Roseivirga ehrenbergii]TCL10321.1 microcystin-dependent protein [Roseivirga ehrenbergii]